ncbi:hypothetical protein [Hymenobacter norwichensis]|uniref:hypothetical protein n=1 Tax=Hymenobacter norwichensis TaxID=223903 RepID=UPI0003B6929F|nr:hypothetical protein [Hymenobacter norwichensis]
MSIKKSVSSILLLGTAIGTAQAQTEAGKLLVSGQVNYYQSKGESTSTTPSGSVANVQQDSKQSSFNFAPQIGFFVADNLALGIRGSVGSGKNIETRNDNGSPNTYHRNDRTKGATIGPFVRYYKMLGERVAFYGQLAGGYQRQIQNNSSYYSGINNEEYYSSEAKSTGGFATLSPGFVFFPTPKLGLELTVGGLSYTASKSESTFQSNQSYQTNYEGTSSSFGANFGLQYLAVGASFHLGN